MGGHLQDPDNFSGRPGLIGFFDPQQHPFPGNGIGQEYGAAVNMADALSLRRVVRDHGLVFPILFQHYSTFSIPSFCRESPTPS